MILKILVLLLKLISFVFTLLTPFLGVWLASSLASYLDGPLWLTIICGALLFPILPLLWEFRSHIVYKRKEDPKPRILTFSDRMILRTLTINLLFLIALLFSFPKQSFTALSVRGDWMLDAYQEHTHKADENPAIKQTRNILFSMAQGLEWLYVLTQDDPYEKFDDGSSTKIKPKPNTSSIKTRPKPKKPTIKPTKKPPSTDKNNKTTPPSGKTTPTKPKPKVEIEHLSHNDDPLLWMKDYKPGDKIVWPPPSKPHPIIHSIPKEAETSIQKVAEYIAKNTKNDVHRIKALHDYVADRIAYDAVALAEGRYPPQDAETVFRKKIGVCAGYSRLMVELGKFTGDRIVYVRGVSRDDDGGIPGTGHAWNAVEIDGGWYLMDVTWDAGYVNGPKFTKRYSSSYFLSPPAYFGHNHLPKDQNWQLRKDPITRGTFVRQPMLNMRFFEHGWELKSPSRSQVTVAGSFEATLTSTIGHKMVAAIKPADKSSSIKEKRCKVTGTTDVRVICKPETSGKYEVTLFSSIPNKNSYLNVAKFQVIVR